VIIVTSDNREAAAPQDAEEAGGVRRRGPSVEEANELAARQAPGIGIESDHAASVPHRARSTRSGRHSARAAAVSARLS
jgi:hypothetical protein